MLLEASAPMKKVKKQYDHEESVQKDSENVAAQVNVLKGIKANLDAKKAEMATDPDFTIADVAVVEKVLANMQVEVESIFKK